MMNLIRIISAIIFFIPFIKGIIFFICSKTTKLKKIAKYKEDENYNYINKLYAISYSVLGLICGIFLNILNICFNFFSKSPISLIFSLGIIMCLEIFMNTFVDIRIKIDEYDKEHNEK